RVSAAVGPKVVQIVTQSVKVAGAGDEQPTGVLVAERGRGSGFFVASDGYVLTNAHVVANAARIHVLVPTPGMPDSPREFSASVAGVDADNDLALLKVEVQGVPFFDLARDATPRQGQLVLGYGSPMGLAQSASLGLVSAVDRQLSADDPRTYIQTDASMNPGNSGGPLVDLEGKLLGINTMILSQSGGSEGLGFAVPLGVIRHSFAALRAGGAVARPRLGIQPRSLSADLIGGLELKVRQGVLVEDVDPYGPAAAGGLLPGDVLLSLGAEPIHTIRDLYRAEYATSAGAPVELAVMRGPDVRLLRITPEGARKTPPAVSAGGVTEKDNLVFRLGIYGTTLTPALASTLGGLRGGPGVLVLALAGAGLAGQSALEPGDVVHSANGAAVDTVEALRGRLEAIPDGGPIVLQIERAGMLSYVAPGAMPGTEQRLKKTSFAMGSDSVNSPLRPLLY
ncbi:MAG: trypsin-like peptidase domain-containing protein, partial [Candidatus Solibacter sp.]|nr:trypsin-like peptidase domain-containing protein [Candidatus Solibacter sp.]